MSKRIKLRVERPKKITSMASLLLATVIAKDLYP